MISLKIGGIIVAAVVAAIFDALPKRLCHKRYQKNGWISEKCLELFYTYYDLRPHMKIDMVTSRL